MLVNLQLNYSEIVQGTFSLTKLNLMMVFQVNCPGCFLYGFPQMLNLHTQYQDSISFFALATAFEDFDLNTAEHARALFKEGKLIGETKKAFEANRLEWDSTIVPFPIIIDTIMTREEMLQPSFIENVITNQPHLREAPTVELEKVTASLHDYFSHYQQCGFTFAANLLQGTPSFILFDDSFDIKLKWFGHVDDLTVENKLKEFL
jgi:hypothetical protein